jgi:hypothetical protein
MAGRSRKYKVALSNMERNRLKEVIRNKKTSNTIRNRCRILLALDENQSSATTYDNCAYYLGVSKPMISNVVKCYALEGIDKVLTINRNINSNNANRKIDGALEARIIAMACSNPPDGHARWTVRLITEKARIELDLSASEETVRRTLKKINCVLT